MAKAAGIIFSSLNSNTHSRLTNDRSVAAIPFAARYRLVDFAISNLVNAGIFNISIVVNYNYRSLISHIGSGKDWDLARRQGGINFVSPFQYSGRRGEVGMFSTHLEALRAMRDYIENAKEEYFVIMDSDNVLNIDINEVISELERSNANIILVTKELGEGFSSKNPRMMVSSHVGEVKDLAMSSRYVAACPELSLGIFIVRTQFLRKIIDEAAAHGLDSFTSLLLKNYRELGVRSFTFGGYIATVSSFLDYYRCSMDLINTDCAFASLFEQDERPIYTRVYSSAPTQYGSKATVGNSIIADDCIVDGEVRNSILFRGVHVERGALVENSVLFSGTHVMCGASLRCIVADKNVTITRATSLSGSEGMPFYIQKGRRV